MLAPLVEVLGLSGYWKMRDPRTKQKVSDIPFEQVTVFSSILIQSFHLPFWPGSSGVEILQSPKLKIVGVGGKSSSNVDGIGLGAGVIPM